MNKKEIAEINKYCDPHSILVVTNKNKLIRLNCPFKVEIIQSIDVLKVGEIRFVEMVKVDTMLQLVYVINGKGYHYRYFKISFSQS